MASIDKRQQTAGGKVVWRAVTVTPKVGSVRRVSSVRSMLSGF